MATAAKSKESVRTVRQSPRKISFGSERSEPALFDEQGKLRKDVQSICLNFFHLAMELGGYLAFTSNKKGTAVKVRLLVKGLEYEEWHSDLEKVAQHIVQIRSEASEPGD